MDNVKATTSKRAAAKVATSKLHPLVGAGLHYEKENDSVQYQASVVAVIPSGSTVGDLALIQYFEWFTGSPSTRRLIPLSELASTDRWVFYSSVEEMNDHYERVDQHRSERAEKSGEP